MDEDSLNGMAYMYWSKDQRLGVRTTVSQVRKDSMAQLERYMQVVKMGPVKDRSDSGVTYPTGNWDGPRIIPAPHKICCIHPKNLRLPPNLKTEITISWETSRKPSA